ncbi:uncharacterized protein BT62DRAFT_1071034 [Guyanagaster necrorhizus]|uniref:Uncharacterized protein n=1 Tax=Guyanagaster necrorhizus TaxID=856835 RepID=A0A9P8AZC4_9AGAR|nr:uncharacterized protein BT62DRAFT_1071034 [Guyanagaster necrorhizus MCA 3950]KAG7451822.1 hypothetical protein BT62DRAFT_1071034 [Guyanagaster necrorhizus MCA 3950]
MSQNAPGHHNVASASSITGLVMSSVASKVSVASPTCNRNNNAFVARLVQLAAALARPNAVQRGSRAIRCVTWSEIAILREIYDNLTSNETCEETATTMHQINLDLDQVARQHRRYKIRYHKVEACIDGGDKIRLSPTSPMTPQAIDSSLTSPSCLDVEFGMGLLVAHDYYEVPTKVTSRFGLRGKTPMLIHGDSLVPIVMATTLPVYCSCVTRTASERRRPFSNTMRTAYDYCALMESRSTKVLFHQL